MSAHSEAVIRYQKRYPEKQRAQVMLQRAIKNNGIKRGVCSVCGTSKNVHGHHPDYSKPLDVIWLCAKHHRELHCLYPKSKLKSIHKNMYVYCDIYPYALVKRFRQKIKDERKTCKWFMINYTDLFQRYQYSRIIGMFNGKPMSTIVENAIKKYLEEEK